MPNGRQDNENNGIELPESFEQLLARETDGLLAPITATGGEEIGALTPGRFYYNRLEEVSDIATEHLTSRLDEARAGHLVRMRAVKSVEAREVKKTSPEDEQEMSRSLNRFLSARNEAEARRNLPGERRESEYLGLVINDQRRALTPDDLRFSETPVHLDGISWDIIKAIAQHGHKDLQEVGDSIQIVCSVCSLIIPTYYAFFCMDSIYCSRHLPKVEECVACNNLYADCKTFTTPEGDLIQVCNRCLGRIRCTDCSNRVPPELSLARQCTTHYHAVAPVAYPRNYSRNGRWMAPKLGEFIQSPRVFSAELEVIVPTSRSVDEVVENLPREVGASGDSSIRTHNEIGIELQTPRLRGASGEELVKRTTAALRGVKATINDSCGFHIHLDGEGVLPKNRQDYPMAFLQLWKAHLVFEDVILSLLPYKRRLNRFCRPMRDYFKLSELSVLTSMFEAEKLWYKQRRFESIAESKGHHYHPSRYFGINMHSLFGDRNLEIRYHTGTVNAKKIFHWVNLHSLIMDAATAGLFTDEFLNESLATMDLKEKTQMLFNRISLNEKSQRYFFERQRKFGNKSASEDESVETSSPRVARIRSIPDPILPVDLQ